MMMRYFAVLWLSLIAMMAGAQVADSIAARMTMQRYVFPQEKVHVMTDKSRYMAGDTIWLRAWVVDAASHQPVDASQFVYVELQNPLDTVVTRVKLRQSDGVFAGHIALQPDMAEGQYQLSAYTMFMQSVGEAYFFKRIIDVTSPLATRYDIRQLMQWDDDGLYVTLRLEDRRSGKLCQFYRMGYVVGQGKWNRRVRGDGEVRLRIRGKELQAPAMLVAFDNYKKYIALPRRQGDYDLTFYPEGGYLVPDVECAMTFKALSTDGTCVRVDGRIVDRAGNEVAALSTAHEGMGLVRFIPQAGMTYTAQVSDTARVARQFALPQVHTRAAVLHVARQGDAACTVRAVGAEAGDDIIVVLQRGNVLAVGQGDITLDMRQLPAGVVQCLLLDHHWRRLSERLLFNRGNAITHTLVATDRAAYDSRQLVRVNTVAAGYAMPQGDYAVAVTDDRSVPTDSASAICINLLLQSELQGHVTHPEYYFIDDSPQRAAHLDLLMMTQGWRRYDVSQALRGYLAEPQWPIERSQVVSGRVLSEWRKRPLADATVNLMAPIIGVAEVAQTDTLGRFNVNLSNFPDSVKCILQATSAQGKKQMNVEIDQDNFPVVTRDAPLRGKAHDESGSDGYLEVEALRAATVDGMRNIILSEVTVTASASKPEDVFQMLSQSHFDEQTFRREGITTLEEVVQKIAGIRIVNGQIVSARGATSIYGDRYNRVPVFISTSGYGSATTNASGDMAMAAPIGGAALQNATVMAAGTGDAAQQGAPVSNGLIEDPTGGMGDFFELSNYVQFQDIKCVEYIAPGMATFLGKEAGKAGALIIVTKTGADVSKNREENYYLHTVTPLGYQKPAEFYAPRYDRGDCGIEPGTDLRNTLYWSPCIKVDGDGKAAFDFYTSDTEATTYTITIEGVTADGQLIHARHTINKN